LPGKDSCSVLHDGESAEHGGSFDKEKRTPFSALLKEKGIACFTEKNDFLFRLRTGWEIGRNMADKRKDSP
jgi:hypothetical protein